MQGLIKVVLFSLLLLAILTLNCSVAGSNLSPMQKRQITTKLIEGSFEDIYRAALTVFQDQDYVIKNTDMESGLIVAEVDREASATRKISGSFLESLFTSGIATTDGTVFEMSCVVNKISENNSEVRLSIQETDYSAESSSVTRKDTKQIYDEQVFQDFFNQIIIEVKRREALK